MSNHIIESRDGISMADKNSENMFAHRKNLKMFETDFSFHIIQKRLQQPLILP